jgi:hypothetical protein
MLHWPISEPLNHLMKKEDCWTTGVQKQVSENKGPGVL